PCCRPSHGPALAARCSLCPAAPPCRGPALLPPQSRPCLCHCRGLCPAAAPVVALLCYRPCRGPALRPPTVAALPSPLVAAPNPSAALCRGPALQLPLSRPCPAPAPGKHPRCPAAPCRLLPRLATRNRAAPPCRAAPPSRAAPRCRAALPFCLHYLCCHSAATAATASMASPTVLTFDAEGRAVDFDMWVDDLQLFLLCDSRDGVSLFDHTSSVSTAPAATAGSTVRSQWTTHDAVARLTVRSHLPPGERAHFGKYKTAKSLYDAVVARYFSPATASLSRLMLPYIFPDLAAFATVADLITHLRTSDARYRAALPTEFSAKNPPPMYITLYYLATRLPDSLSSVRDHFLSLCPTELTVDLLEERLAAGENSILAVGASRGDRRTPFFEGCSPVPLLPSVASAAAIDLVGTEEVGAASGQVAASNLVFAAASRSSPASASCSCRPLTHETLLWHHRLGHPSLPRLRGMASHTLVSGLPRSLPPLPPGPAPTCVPSVEGRQRAAPHSSTAKRTITLTRAHMVQQVLQRFGFTYSSPQSTPLPTGHSLSAPPSDESVEPSGPYPELVGCLMYLMTCTRSDLAYPLSLLARYVAPGRHRKGYTFSPCSGSVSWRSTRSSSVLSSSCDAEIYAGAMTAQELHWLTYLLTDLGEAPRSRPVLYVNNKAMLALCQEHRLEHRTKHIALRYFLARELQQRGQLRLVYVASQANTADVFTKALQPCDHQHFCTVLSLVPTSPHLLTS
ncbi:unnamed protein product, partial [Closterium sp. NIES-54]